MAFIYLVTLVLVMCVSFYILLRRAYNYYGDFPDMEDMFMISLMSIIVGVAWPLTSPLALVYYLFKLTHK